MSSSDKLRGPVAGREAEYAEMLANKADGQATQGPIASVFGSSGSLRNSDNAQHDAAQIRNDEAVRQAQDKVRRS